MALARSIIESLADKTLALDIYKKAEARFTTFDQLFKLAQAITVDTGDTAVAGEVYQKTLGAQPNCKQLIDVAKALVEEIQDKPAAQKVLKQAELAVKSNDEFKKTGEAIQQYADDQGWIDAIKEQLDIREANAALYTEFIAREAECGTSAALVNLCAGGV